MAFGGNTNNNNNNDESNTVLNVNNIYDVLNNDNNEHQKIMRIRGVNLRGWLVLERWITPYLFSLNSCHLNGDFCWYPEQIDAPPSNHPDYQICDLYHCRSVLVDRSMTKNDDGTTVITMKDFPYDEYSLFQAFSNNNNNNNNNNNANQNNGHQIIGAEYLNKHLDYFISHDDVMELAKSGITHIKVPIPHYITKKDRFNTNNNNNNNNNNNHEEEWIIVGNRWLYFVRFINWCRLANIQVWPTLQTVPFVGHTKRSSTTKNPYYDCFEDWNDPQWNIPQRTLESLQQITQAIVQDGLQDVVTGFGIDIFDSTSPATSLSMNCQWDITTTNNAKKNNQPIMQQFYQQAIQIIQSTLGTNTNVFIESPTGTGTTTTTTTSTTTTTTSTTTKNAIMDALCSNSNNAQCYNTSFVDHHQYHVFAEQLRALSPRQHIAYTCRNNNHDQSESSSLSFNTLYDFSAAYDILPEAKLFDIMKGIQDGGIAPELDRGIGATNDRQRNAFLQNFVTAQMVSYDGNGNGNGDTATTTAARGWFFSNVKMEGGAFAEWDYLRGIREGWIPTPLANPDTSSQQLFGTCETILFRADDSMDIVQEFPPHPSKSSKSNNNNNQIDWFTMEDKTYDYHLDDEIIASHGDSLLKNYNTQGEHQTTTSTSTIASTATQGTTFGTTISETEQGKVGGIVGSATTPTITATAGTNTTRGGLSLFPLFLIAFFGYGVWYVFIRKPDNPRNNNNHHNYQNTFSGGFQPQPQPQQQQQQYPGAAYSDASTNYNNNNNAYTHGGYSDHHHHQQQQQQQPSYH